MQHPCLSCGACCAAFHVFFPDHELKSRGGEVPDAFTRACKHRDYREMFVLAGRCSGLEGKLGKQVSCFIYEQRPSVCRAFTPSFEDGAPNPLCDEARATLGLAPLTAADFPASPKSATGADPA